MYLFIYRLILFIAWPQFSSAKQIKYCNQRTFYLTNVCLPCLLACLLDISMVSNHYFHNEHICMTCSSCIVLANLYSLVRIYNITISHNKRSGTEQNVCDIKINLQICPLLDTGSNQLFYLIHNYVAFDQYTGYG